MRVRVLTWVVIVMKVYLQRRVLRMKVLTLVLLRAVPLIARDLPGHQDVMLFREMLTVVCSSPLELRAVSHPLYSVLPPGPRPLAKPLQAWCPVRSLLSSTRAPLLSILYHRLCVSVSCE